MRMRRLAVNDGKSHREIRRISKHFISTICAKSDIAHFARFIYSSQNNVFKYVLARHLYFRRTRHGRKQDILCHVAVSVGK